MRRHKVDQIFWTLFLSIQLLWQTGEGKCSRDDCLINVMMLDDHEFPETAKNLKPAVKLGLLMLDEDLKGKSTVPRHSSSVCACVHVCVRACEREMVPLGVLSVPSEAKLNPLQRT